MCLELWIGDSIGKIYRSLHPVADYADPQDPKNVKKISCLTCHRAHAGGAKAMLITGQPPSLSFCSQCHK
jgi:predicted CXXCH cytochrome family protein